MPSVFFKLGRLIQVAGIWPSSVSRSSFPRSSYKFLKKLDTDSQLQEVLINTSILEERKRHEMEKRVGTKELEDCRDQLSAAKRHAESIALITPELKQAFLEIKEMEAKVKEQEKLAEQACLHYEHCKKELEDCRDQLSAAMRHAESIALITPELKQAFLEAFITQDSADRDLLVRNLKSFDVPILNYTRGPFQLTEEMHKLGIYSWLDQVSEAPFAVKEVMISQFGLQHSEVLINTSILEKGKRHGEGKKRVGKKELEDCCDQLSATMRHAESIALITPELKHAFLEMPSTIEEWEAVIQDTVYQANSILCLNPNALEQYETRQRKIDSLSKKHEMDEKELYCHLNDINSLKGNWTTSNS